MTSILIGLLFAGAAVLAVAAVVSTWARCRDSVVANLVALPAVAAERSFWVRIVGHGRHPALAGHPSLRRLPHRAGHRPAVKPTPPRRAAA